MMVTDDDGDGDGDDDDDDGDGDGDDDDDGDDYDGDDYASSFCDFWKITISPYFTLFVSPVSPERMFVETHSDPNSVYCPCVRPCVR